MVKAYICGTLRLVRGKWVLVDIDVYSEDCTTLTVHLGSMRYCNFNSFSGADYHQASAAAKEYLAWLRKDLGLVVKANTESTAPMFFAYVLGKNEVRDGKWRLTDLIVSREPHDVANRNAGEERYTAVGTCSAATYEVAEEKANRVARSYQYLLEVDDEEGS